MYTFVFIVSIVIALFITFIVNYTYKVYLDDERLEPEGWVKIKTAPVCITFLKMFKCEIISLDHDLGDDSCGTGYDVICWIEEQVATNPKFICPKIIIHTANPSARLKMEAAAKSIEKMLKEKS